MLELGGWKCGGGVKGSQQWWLCNRRFADSNTITSHTCFSRCSTYFIAPSNLAKCHKLCSLPFFPSQRICGKLDLKFLFRNLSKFCGHGVPPFCKYATQRYPIGYYPITQWVLPILSTHRTTVIQGDFLTDPPLKVQSTKTLRCI